MQRSYGYHLATAIKNPVRIDINYNQVRTSVYHRYKHGPNKFSSPEPQASDYWRWTKESFTRKGFNESKQLAKEIFHRKARFYEKKFDLDELYIFEHFDSDKFLKEWKIGADSDTLHGFSSGQLTRSPSGHALFKGVLDTRCPDDGLTEYSGFVAMMGPSAPRNKFFQFETKYNWTDFTAFEIRYRGDGRLYNIVVNTASYRNDIQYYDNYTYPLYTRGGPYWQTLRVPIKNFVYTVKNRPQDEQGLLPKYKVKFVAINIQDRNDGPFALEIDYMGLVKDFYWICHDQTPYESYQHAHIKYRQVSLGCDPPES